MTDIKSDTETNTENELSEDPGNEVRHRVPKYSFSNELIDITDRPR